MKRLVVVMLMLAALPAVADEGQGRLAAPDWVDPMSGRPRPDILVYYFHNTFRCQTCLTMESEAEAVVRDDFADDVESGLIAWKTVNLQEPEHEHFSLRYSLDGPSVVIVEWGQDREVRWKNLDRIWELVDSPVQYREYVRGELAAYLAGDEAEPLREQR